MLFLDKKTNEIIGELSGWEGLSQFKSSLDRTGQLSERQQYIDGLLDSDVELITEEQAEAKLSVPHRLTPAQARLALDSIGKLDDVENLILNPQTPKEAKILWNHATYFDRKNPVLISLATAIGLDSNQVDQLFTEGAKINA